MYFHLMCIVFSFFYFKKLAALLCVHKANYGHIRAFLNDCGCNWFIYNKNMFCFFNLVIWYFLIKRAIGRKDFSSDEGKFDFMIVDTSPSWDTLIINALFL